MRTLFILACSGEFRPAAKPATKFEEKYKIESSSNFTFGYSADVMPGGKVVHVPHEVSFFRIW